MTGTISKQNRKKNGTLWGETLWGHGLYFALPVPRAACQPPNIYKPRRKDEYMNYEGFKRKVGSMSRLSSEDPVQRHNSRQVRSRRLWSPKKYRKGTTDKMVSHYVSGFVDALQFRVQNCRLIFDKIFDFR